QPYLRGHLVVPIVGGLSGTGLAHPESLRGLAHQLGLDDLVRFSEAVPQADLADWYRAADLTVVPSYSESFGLVAIESQACATPVVSAAVGGVPDAVRDGVSGVLVDGHDSVDWAHALGGLLADDQRRRTMRGGA